ncbi:MAG TPA: bacteriophage holin [Nitrospinota bacterium]|nr:bacteriophage holin [Nitrospinota bacterium]
MLNVRALSASVGVIWGLTMMVTGWTAAFGWGEEVVTLMESFYIGYGPGFQGGLIGGIWGTVDGGVCGLIFGLLYNWFSTKF